MPVFEWIFGAYMAYSLWFNDDFYNLVFEGMYGSIWITPLPDNLAIMMPGYDKYLEANPKAVATKVEEVPVKKEEIVPAKKEEIAVKTEEVEDFTKKDSDKTEDKKSDDDSKN